MSGTKWLIGIAMLWLIFTVTSNIVEQADPLERMVTNPAGAAEDPQCGDMTPLEKLTSYQHIEVDNPVGALFQGVEATGCVLSGLWDILWFNYSFLDDNFAGQFLKYFCICLSIGIMFGIAITIIEVIRG